MEDWQITHVNRNLPNLILVTKFDWALKAELLAENIIHQADVKKLDAVQKQDGEFEACSQYYQLLLGREGAYKVLTKALIKYNQTGASGILIRVPAGLCRRPLTYLGISTELSNFQDVDIEVHGRTLKFQEYFDTSKYQILEQIFRDTFSEVEFYEIFVTKLKRLVIATNTIPPTPPFYVPRFLSNRIKIDESIFKADCPDVFVFRNTIARYKLSEIVTPHPTYTSSSQLTKITCRFIYLEEYEDWTELKKIAIMPIHLVNYENGQNHFILEDSSGASDVLRKLGCRNDRVYISEEEFVEQQLSKDSASQRVCICDTPGMGKTLLLGKIARRIAEKTTSRLFVFIPLASFAKDFCKDAPNIISQPEASLMNVLSYITPPRQNPELLAKLVKSNLLSLELFFDGFDEIPYEKLAWSRQTFRSITTNVPDVKIYITSRPHMRYGLEERLGVVAYDILPFDQQNQVDFLVQFWQSSKPDFDQLFTQKYATSCLEAVNNSLTKNDKEIAGIPLLCQLIAEVYGDKSALYSIKRGNLSDVPIKISGMYQKFIEKKIHLVSKDKKEFEDFNLVHIWHALKLLFPTNGLHEEKLFTSVKGLLRSPVVLRAGLIQKNSNGNLDFIHRTFAEYLVADYASMKLQDGQKMYKAEKMTYNLKSILSLLLNPTWNYEFMDPVIVSFFDSVLGEINISEELKKQGAVFVSSISHIKFISILSACCQRYLLNIVSFLLNSLTKCNNSWVLKCFTNKNSYELLSFCITKSTSQMFHACTQILVGHFKLNLDQINTFNNSNTLLRLAVGCVNYEAVEYFVDRISLRNQYLLEECFSGGIGQRESILYLLLKKVPTLTNESPDIFVNLEKYSRIDVRLFKILVEFGANINTADAQGKNCVMLAATYMSPSDYHGLVQFLLTECKADHLFVENEKWKDPLPYIIERASLLPETLELLLNIPRNDINLKDRYGDKLLYSAATKNQVDILKQLVDRGFDYNARGMENRSLLHVAADWGGVEMFRYLLSLKLDPNSRDQNEWTPLHYAAEYSNNLSVVKVLVENGANVLAKTNKCKTALHLSTANPNSEVIKYLIGKGVGVNDRDKYGNTPLHLCLTKEAMEFLIEMGADIHAKKNDGQTALHLSTAYKYPSSIEVIKYLIGKGAGVNDRDNEGNTPLHLCIRKEVRGCLIEMGADMHAKNNGGKTPAQMKPWLWK